GQVRVRPVHGRASQPSRAVGTRSPAAAKLIPPQLPSRLQPGPLADEAGGPMRFGRSAPASRGNQPLTTIGPVRTGSTPVEVALVWTDFARNPSFAVGGRRGFQRIFGCSASRL